MYKKYKHVIDHCFTEEEIQEIIPLFELLMYEFENANDNFKTMRKSLLNAILLYLFRRIDSDVREPQSATSLLVQKALFYLEEHFTQKDITLYYVSEKLNVTPNYLGRIIKETIGMTFNNYLTKRRISYSLKVLNQNILTINQVADNCGFSSTEYFISKFKAIYGITSKQYLLDINK